MNNFKEMTDDLMRTVSAFRQKNDEHFREIERKKVDDVVLRDEVNRINAAIDDVRDTMQSELLSQKRAAIFAGASYEKAHMTRDERDYSKTFNSYLRGEFGSDERPREMRDAHKSAIEAKALATTSEPDGGFTVLPQVERTLVNLTLLISPIRQFANVQQIGSGSLRQVINKRGTTSGWVGETDPRTQTATSQLAEIEYVPGEIFAMPAATQQMLDDSFIDVENWIMSEASTVFAQKEGLAFISGDGVKKPRGFLTANIVADSSYSWGSLGYFPTGAAGDFTTPSQTINTGPDCFYDVVFGLRPQYRANARWAMNRRVQARLRKFKDSYANYLWQPSLVAGAPPTFAGYEIIDTEDMPDLAANSLSIIFADWNSFYRIVDRVGIRTLRDPFSNKPYVLFYTTKRVGGGILNFEAAKILKASVS